MVTQLLDDRYAPITSEFGFLECDAEIAAKEFILWQQPIQEPRRVALSVAHVNGSLPNRLVHLLPLTSVEARRFLFLPTASRWTAFLDNGWQGTDAFSVVSQLSSIIRCRGLRVVSVPNTIRSAAREAPGRFGATVLEVYDNDPAQCHFLNIRRSISAVNDGGRWQFDANGEPFGFENLESYKARQVRDRFTPILLHQYLHNFGIRFTSPEFYEVPSPGFLVSKDGPVANGLAEYSLDEVRATY